MCSSYKIYSKDRLNIKATLGFKLRYKILQYSLKMTSTNIILI